MAECLQVVQGIWREAELPCSGVACTRLLSPARLRGLDQSAHLQHLPTEPRVLLGHGGLADVHRLVEPRGPASPWPLRAAPCREWGLSQSSQFLDVGELWSLCGCGCNIGYDA